MDKTLLLNGAKRYGATLSSLYLLGGFSDNVYKAKANGRNIVIKYYLSFKYDKKAIHSELDWILFLMKSDINIAAPIPSLNGNHLEVIELKDGEECYVCAFELVKGTFINISNRNEWNKDFFFIMGKTLGKIHSLSKNYKPNNDIIPNEWNQGKLFTKNLESNNRLSSILEKYTGTLERLPKHKSIYGMIHNDLHYKNFYVHNNEIMLFDFGDCEYNWYVYDIAIVIYHAIQTVDENHKQDRIVFAYEFAQFFLSGYFTENRLSSEWISMLPFFLNYRRIYSFIYFSHFLSEHQKDNHRIRRILANLRIKIEEDLPYVELQMNRILKG